MRMHSASVTIVKTWRELILETSNYLTLNCLPMWQTAYTCTQPTSYASYKHYTQPSTPLTTRDWSEETCPDTPEKNSNYGKIKNAEFRLAEPSQNMARRGLVMPRMKPIHPSHIVQNFVPTLVHPKQFILCLPLMLPS